MEPEFVRSDWITRSQFAPVDDHEVLTQLMARVRAWAAEASTPVVVLDLDSTLYEVAPRTLHIIREWAGSAPDSHDMAPAIQALRDAVMQVQVHQVGYSLRDTLAEVGIDSRDEVYRRPFDELKNYWARRFFSNQDLHHDRPYAGAADWVRDLYAAGAQIVYLTGRDRPNMWEGTVANLARDGFPLEAAAAQNRLPGEASKLRTHLYLKAHPSVPDVDHKVSAVREVSRLGRVAAQFENEPKNFVALTHAFPEAMHVFMHTVSSDHPAAAVKHPDHSVYRIRSFPRHSAQGS